MQRVNSNSLHEEALNHLVGGVNSPVRAFKSVHGNPIYFESASGAIVTDVDGNELVDFVQSWGPLIHGHSHPEIIEMVYQKMQKGTSFGAPHIGEIELAKRVKNRFPYMDKVRFVSSGTEAVMSAVRLARGYTGRDLLIKFEGCYHGHVDSLMVNSGSGLATFGIASSPGIPKDTVATTLVAPLDDIEAVEYLFDEHGDEIAAVVIEPLPANNGLLVQRHEYLAKLRELCDEHGALLIFDEVISGFRFKDGSYGDICGVAPDITALGKVIGGGLPVGAYGARSEIMQKLSTLDIHGVADNGAEYLDLGTRGLKGKTEFYFRRGDGSSLYATRDIAYHIWKFSQCDNLINILGEDHKLQSKQVSLTLNELGYDSPEVLFYSFIKLPEGKMSTRKGNVVFMDDLLEEAKEHAANLVREIRTDYNDVEIAEIAEAVGTSAVRFNIIKVSPDKGFTFRWEEALSFDSDSAPFIMYSHTRSRSISNKCLALGVTFDDIDYSKLENENHEMPNSMYELLRVMVTHNDALSKSVEQNRPNLFANQLLNLANSYNGFYRDCKVISDGKVNEMYLAVSEIASKLMKSGMIGLGISPLEQM